MAAMQTGAEPTAWWAQAAEAAPAVAEDRAPIRRVRADAAAERYLRKGLVVVVASGALLAATALAGVAVTQQGLHLDTLRQQVTQAQGQDRHLQAQLAALQSPQRIERTAVDRLGMQRPAAYVAIAAAHVPAASPPVPAATRQVVLPAPTGPAPGGVVALSRQLWAWLRLAGRRVGV